MRDIDRAKVYTEHLGKNMRSANAVQSQAEESAEKSAEKSTKTSGAEGQ